MNRIDACFASLRQQKRAGLITFVTAGDPNPAASIEILTLLPEAGADIIEVGMPFSDPMADGPAIQAANQRALKAGMTLSATLQLVRQFREKDRTTPLVLMGYLNPIASYGRDRFLDDAKAAGVDGLIIVDVPPEEDEEICIPATAKGLNFVRLLTPTSDDQRLDALLPNARGFLYYVSVAGTTGAKAADAVSVTRALERIRRKTSLPIAVGFGIKSAEDAAAIAGVADAVVVGSSIVDRIARNLEAKGTPMATLNTELRSFVETLATAIRATSKG